MRTVRARNDHHALGDLLARVERIREALEDADVLLAELVLDDRLDDPWATIEAEERRS